MWQQTILYRSSAHLLQLSDIICMTAKRKPPEKRTTSVRKTATRKTTPVKEKTLNDIILKVKTKYGSQKIWVLDNIAWEERNLISGKGGKWDIDLKQFIYVGNSLPTDLQQYESEPYSLAKWLEDELNNNNKPVPTVKTFTPRPHQTVGVKKIVSSASHGWRGFIEADNVGVGKSLISLLGAAGVAKLKGFTNSNPAKLLIICPKAVIPHWRNTIANSGVDNLRIVVINYDRSKNLLTVPAAASAAKTTRTKNRRISSNGNPLIKWDIIIADESHKLKNFETSQRAKAFENIAEYTTNVKTAPFVIWATATIGQNPLELGYLAPLIGQMTGVNNLGLKTFGKWLENNNYNVKEGKVGYSWIGFKPTDPPQIKNSIIALQKQDIQLMRDLLFNPTAPSIRRNPEDIAGWPEINRMTVPYQLSFNEYAQYVKAWLEFREEMKLHPKGKDPAGALAAQLRFRQKASLIMVDKTVEYVLELLDNGLQVAVSIEFIETLNLIKQALEKNYYNVSVFSGVNSATREQERIAFQKGKTDVILFTVEEGVSFHAGEILSDGSKATLTPRATIIHDIRYSSISCSQIEGRCHRDGQLANVYYPYLEKTVQEKIVQTMIRRMSNMRKLSGDNVNIVDEIENILNTFH